MFSRFAILGPATIALAFLSSTLAAEEDLDRAISLERTGRWEEALEAYEALEDDRPAEAAPGIVRTLRMTGQRQPLAEALSRFEEAKYASPALELERAYEDDAAGRDDEAKKRLESLAESSPTARGYWLVSEIAVERGEIEAALVACDLALKIHGEDPRPLDDQRYVGLCEARVAKFRAEPKRFQRLVQEFYPGILERNPDAWWAAFDAAELYATKFDGANSQRLFDVARGIAPRQPELILTRARWEIDAFRPAAAQRMLDKLDGRDPFPAETARLRADAELALFRFDEATLRLKEALAIDPHDPRTLGRLQAIHATRREFPLDSPVENSKQIESYANQRAPKGSLFYETLGDAFDRLRKYPQAADAYAEALRRVPDSGDLCAKLGLIQMRLAQEGEARRNLERAFSIDPYHVRAKNQLETLDLLDSYAALETEHFILRFDRGKDEVLARNMAYFLERDAYPQAVQRMGAEPPRKTVIEVFSDGRGSTGSQWFGARMTGLPYLPTIGACAGRVVAIVSPGSLEEPYAWARVLKHEFVHVVNLDQTDFNVPHWLTEGLAVWTEDLPRPADWLPLLARRRSEGTLFDLDTIDAGFVRPDSRENWNLAYCQAEIYVETLHALRGEEGLRDLLARIREGRPFEEALVSSVGISKAELEEGADRAIDALLAESSVAAKEPPTTLAQFLDRFERDPEDVETLAGLSEAYALREDFARAVPFARAALKKEANHPVATATLARSAVARGELDEAEKLLARAQEALPEPDERLTSLRIAVGARAGDLERVAWLYRDALERWPDDPKWQQGAATVFERIEAWDDLVGVLTPLARREHDDPLLAERLFRACLKAERPAEAELAAEALLRIRIDAVDAHAFVGQRAFERGDFERAKLALESALAFDPARAEAIRLLIELAKREGDEAQIRDLEGRLERATNESEDADSNPDDDERP